MDRQANCLNSFSTYLTVHFPVSSHDIIEIVQHQPYMASALLALLGLLVSPAPCYECAGPVVPHVALDQVSEERYWD